MPDGFGGLSDDAVEVLVNYTAAQQAIQAVDTAPGWVVIGGFEPDLDVGARLELVGSVSQPGLIMSTRVWLSDGADSQPVGGSAALSTEATSAVKTADAVPFKAGKIYQLQVQVVGGSDDADFGICNSVQLTV